tara:strand:+ start:311 stop:538 length:228 start_codon:yes stop_codon:yes gene_type:complete
MMPKKRHYLESTTVSDVELKVEKYGETGEINRVFIGDVDVTELLEYVQHSEDFFTSLETLPEIDEDGIYERLNDK